MKLTLYWNSRASHGGFTILTSTPVQQQKKCRTFFRAVSMVPEARQSAVCASQKKTKKNQGHGHSRVSHGWRSIDRTQHWDRPQLPGADKRTATAEIYWYTYIGDIYHWLQETVRLWALHCQLEPQFVGQTPLKQYSCLKQRFTGFVVIFCDKNQWEFNLGHFQLDVAAKQNAGHVCSFLWAVSMVQDTSISWAWVVKRVWNVPRRSALLAWPLL